LIGEGELPEAMAVKSVLMLCNKSTGLLTFGLVVPEEKAEV